MVEPQNESVQQLTKAILRKLDELSMAPELALHGIWQAFRMVWIYFAGQQARAQAGGAEAMEGLSAVAYARARRWVEQRLDEWEDELTA